MKKILLLSVSAGAGHMRAAQAIAATASAMGEPVEATHLDVMAYVSNGFRTLYTDFYIKLVSNHPALWGYLYQKTDAADQSAFGQKLRRAVERLNCRTLLAEIKTMQPDAIVCTHFLPAELLSRELRKGRLDVPVWVQVTDFDLHSMWIVPHMSGYFAANDEIAYRMRERGLAPEAVHVSGIPIMPTFAVPPDRATCAAEYGLDPQRTTFLMMAGGAGLGSLPELAERLLVMPGDFQLIAMAGKNEAMLAALHEVAARHPGRLFPQGFTDKVERLMACADLVITKPGGLTTSECLAMGLPMIINSPIPGQEERNADFLLEQGVALKAIDATALEYRIRALLEQPQRLADMRARIATLGRPHAARTVLERVLAGPAGAKA
ncbi:MGDG synthase family glycosyltransferase [Andreprevotia lacus]|nr:glycosyltransferase [Andreprevotia lacus]